MVGGCGGGGVNGVIVCNDFTEQEVNELWGDVISGLFFINNNKYTLYKYLV